MDNYEINILRRGGNWKKVKPDDLIIDEINDDYIKDDDLKIKDPNKDFLSYVKNVESIVIKLETLENEKIKLKKELKSYEDVFLNKKKIVEDKISKISKEKEFIDKTIQVIKNLKSF